MAQRNMRSLTVIFHTPAAGNHIGDDIRSLAFLLNSAKFVSTKSQSNVVWLHRPD
jgi:hypothetical protein